jgi:hypothetical protein
MYRAVLKERLFLRLGLCLLFVWLEFNALAEGQLPDVATVVQRVLQRAEQTAQTPEELKYCYKKRSLTEELDDSGKPVKSTEKIYEVTPIEGVPFSRLIRIQNRDLTEEERAAQDRKEERFRQKLAEKKSPVHPREDELTSDLVKRYDYKVLRREHVDNRSVLVLSFRAKSPRPPEQSIEDKVLNRLAGQVWVDEAEWEVLQVRVELTEDLSLGLFGMFGSIKRCDVKIEQQRLPDNVWVKKSFAVLLAGRKVFTPMGYRKIEEFYNFRKPARGLTSPQH